MVPATSAVERYAILAVRRGITLGALYSASVGDFELVLAAAGIARDARARDAAARELRKARWQQGKGSANA